VDPRELTIKQQVLEAMMSSDPAVTRLLHATNSPVPLDRIENDLVNPKLVNQAADLAGYRGNLGLHPAPVSGAPGIQIRMESDTAAQPQRPKRNY
jgi:hypothetical protein